MNDREKVIGHLYDCLVASRLENMWVFVRKDIVGDALTMLKEQEAVEPGKEDDGNPEPCTAWWYVCGSCGQPIDKMDRYCRMCGREVAWE